MLRQIHKCSSLGVQNYHRYPFTIARVQCYRGRSKANDITHVAGRCGRQSWFLTHTCYVGSTLGRKAAGPLLACLDSSMSSRMGKLNPLECLYIHFLVKPFHFVLISAPLSCISVTLWSPDTVRLLLYLHLRIFFELLQLLHRARIPHD